MLAVGSKVRITAPAPSHYIGNSGVVERITKNDEYGVLLDRWPSETRWFLRCELKKIKDDVLSAGYFRCGCTAITSNASHKCCDCMGVKPKIFMSRLTWADILCVAKDAE